MKKCAMKVELEKNDMSIKNVFDEGKEFIRLLWKTHVMDINVPQVNDS